MLGSTALLAPLDTETLLWFLRLALPTHTLHSRRTQLHRHCTTTISLLTTKPLLPTSMLTTMLRPIPRRKPNLGRVSCMHGVMQRGWVFQHDLLLDLWLQAMQVGHENILHRHDMPHLQHQASEFFTIFCYSSYLS